MYDPLYYDKNGQPINDILDWGRLLADEKYRVVKQERLWWGGWLSTVWLGLNHNWGEGKPIIFESMLFLGFRSDLDSRRYSTLEEAHKGHKMMKRYWDNPLNILSVLISEVWVKILHTIKT